MIPEWHFAGRQITGDRPRQEDTYSFMGLGAGADEYDPLLAIVADGMGGYNAGDVASNLTVDAFIQEAAKSAGDWFALFLGALQRANAAIARANAEAGMSGCTVLAVVFQQKRLYWVSVGDTSLLLFRGGALVRLNADHSLRTVTREKVERGELTETEANAQSNLLRSAVSGEAIELIDLNVDGLPLEAGDLVLLASDGLETIPHELMTERLARLRHSSSGSIARSLLNTVENLRQPQQDNTTVLCVKI
jgi:serine/threonine protein phosphatase PrpC